MAGDNRPEPRRRGLGRGLSALLGSDGGDDGTPGPAPIGLRILPVERLQPGRFQPRRRFTEEALDELAQSIAAQGVLQPILVRRLGEGETYEIIAGERRWRAAQRAKLDRVPVVVRDLKDDEALEVALVENLQRQDLSPVEEAEAYARLIREFGHTQEALGKLVGKSRSHVANLLRLLSLPAGVKAMMDEGRLSAGHARTLVGREDAEALARTIADKGLSVRQAEALTQGRTTGRAGAQEPRGVAVPKDSDTRALEEELAASLELPVAIVHRGGEGGTVTVRYRTLEELDEVCRRLSNPGAGA